MRILALSAFDDLSEKVQRKWDGTRGLLLLFSSGTQSETIFPFWKRKQALFLLLLGLHSRGGLERDHLLNSQEQPSNEGDHVVLEQGMEVVLEQGRLGLILQGAGGEKPKRDLQGLDSQHGEGNVSKEDEEAEDIRNLAGGGGRRPEGVDEPEDVAEGPHGRQEELDSLQEHG